MSLGIHRPFVPRIDTPNLWAQAKAQQQANAFLRRKYSHHGEGHSAGKEVAEGARQRHQVIPIQPLKAKERIVVNRKRFRPITLSTLERQGKDK